jgi:hypothetical protein
MNSFGSLAPINCESKPLSLESNIIVPSIGPINNGEIFNCSQGVISPPTFQIRIDKKDETARVIYSVSMGSGSEIFFQIIYTKDNSGIKNPYLQNKRFPPGTMVSDLLENNNFKNIRIEFDHDINVEVKGFGYRQENFVSGKYGSDKYTLIFPDDITTARSKYLTAKFYRPIGGNITSISIGSSSISKILQTNIEIPRIDISGQTLIDGSDVGETRFTISDKFFYYSNDPIELNTKICKKNYIIIEDLKKTVFDRSCPKMVSVFIGEGEFLYTKVEKLWVTLNIIDPNLTIFYNDVIRYGMVRYILSRILYGNFNINYLLRKYYKKFLIDLGKSRFCGAVQFFKDPTYSNMYKYFK